MRGSAGGRMPGTVNWQPHLWREPDDSLDGRPIYLPQSADAAGILCAEIYSEIHT
jgi:hypothetical protein